MVVVSAVGASPRPKIILDTDIARVSAEGISASDIDDLGALTILNALAAQGFCETLAVVTSTRSDTVAGMIDAVNTTFGHPDVPIGIKGGNEDLIVDQNSYARVLTQKFTHDQTSAGAPAAQDLLRSLLVDTPTDETVIYIHADILAHWEYLCFDALWESSADEHSDLSGKELVNLKVDEIVSYLPCLPNNGVSENCPPWADNPTSNAPALANWLADYRGMVTGNTAAPAEVHVPTNLLTSSAEDPITLAFSYYYTETPPPWRDNAELPDAVSLYGDPFGVYFSILSRTGNAIGTISHHKGSLTLTADEKLRWNPSADRPNHRYFHTDPAQQDKFLQHMASLFEYRPDE